MLVQIKILENGKGLNLPFYATANSAGMDVFAAVTEKETIKVGRIKVVPLGFAMALPEGVEAQIRSRSGLARSGVFVLNAPGTIDSDYSGEVAAIMMNLGESDFVVERGLRIAQMVFSKFCTANLSVVESLEDTTRSSGGFGSTGMW
jgi:dUTP pyrophosphatase